MFTIGDVLETIRLGTVGNLCNVYLIDPYHDGPPKAIGIQDLYDLPSWFLTSIRKSEEKFMGYNLYVELPSEYDLTLSLNGEKNRNYKIIKTSPTFVYKFPITIKGEK